MDIELHTEKIVRWIVIVALSLVVVHSIVLAIYFYIDDPEVFDFVRLIDLDYEGNIPTLFSSLLFLLNGALLYCVYAGARQTGLRYSSYWLGLALIFVFLGFDEGTRLHEEIGDLFENVVVAEGLLYFPWVIPYSIVFGILVLLYFRFYLTLDRGLQLRLFWCAVIFLSGAIGVELLSAQEADESGTSSLSYSILYTIEESLEMAGLILLIDTLLKKLRGDQGQLTLQLS